MQRHLRCFFFVLGRWLTPCFPPHDNRVIVVLLYRYVIDLYEVEVPPKYRREIYEEPMRRAQVEVSLLYKGLSVSEIYFIFQEKQEMRTYFLCMFPFLFGHSTNMFVVVRNKKHEK